MHHLSGITRRDALRAAGTAGTADAAGSPLLTLLSAEQATAERRCARLTPELTEGPYWVNTRLRRSDVRSNSHGGARQRGIPLRLVINVYDSTRGCGPLDGVAVDIWHANAHGVYSAEPSQQAGGHTRGADTSADNWLRGYQITGRDRGVRRRVVRGQVSFHTIWPGWYSGRAIHIHVRIRRLSHRGATIAGYTTQIFFSDVDNDRVLTGSTPYNTRAIPKGPTTDENDTVLATADRATNIVAVRGNLHHGFATTFNVMLSDAEIGAKGSLGRPRFGGPGGPPPAA